MGMRLVDDVDALQAQAAHETRELELMSSIDERAALVRQFNTLRGQDTDDVGTLGELPTGAMLLKMVKDPNKRMSREDFGMIYQQAVASQAEAAGARSMIRPQLDVVAGVASNGFDPSRSASWEETQDYSNPGWHVGVQFSVPLDYSLLKNLRHGFNSQKRAAEQKMEAAKFNEERAWDDIIKQRHEAQRRFEKASSLEKVQTSLVKRERSRLMNGRSTTFQSLTIEQNLAMAQIQRVRAQLALLQVHNLVKSFEVAQ
jgi:outer membrane protein TolC